MRGLAGIEQTRSGNAPARHAMRGMLLGWVLTCVVAGGCATTGAPHRGDDFSFTQVKARPASLLVARKFERPLYIVLDANRVKDVWRLSTYGCEIKRADCVYFNLVDVQTFVRRDLKAAMGNYFSTVEVVESAQALPAAPHVVADVKIDDLRFNFHDRGALVYSVLEMTWGFALRRSEQVDYAYSFAGVASSGDTYSSFEKGCAALVEDALGSMLKKWTEAGAASFREAEPTTPPQRAANPGETQL